MKKVVITARLVKEESHGEVRDALDVRWAALCAEMGVVPLLCPSSADTEIFLRETAAAGLILTGGNDLSIFSSQPLSRQRDDFEQKLLENALAMNLPVLGVCRGMQLIAWHFGGELTAVSGHVASVHDLVCGQSRYARWLEKITQVNSYHGYGVAVAPAGFTVAARSGDGCIEAIEHGQKRIFGQMWHPERTQPFSPQEIGLLRQVLS